MAVFQIDDPDDPRIADFRNLRDPALRDQRRLFIAEGRLVVRRLLDSDRLETRALMVTAAAVAGLGAVRADLPVYLVPQTVMDTVTGFNVHRGCLALGDRGATQDWRWLAAAARRLVVLERVGNPDNVGGVFRNASAFGADAVLLGPDCADPFYRKAIRTSMGAALVIPFAPLAPWPGALAELRDVGLVLVALTTDAGARPVSELRRTAATRVAVVVGHEGDGLSAATIGMCQVAARIPMATGHDSLNVATAVAIALHELFTIDDA